MAHLFDPEVLGSYGTDLAMFGVFRGARHLQHGAPPARHAPSLSV